MNEDCMSFESLTLKKHQRRTIKLMRELGKNRKEDGKQKGLIAFHSMGAGKTATALITANCLVKDGTVKRTIFLVPASSVQQAKDAPTDLGIEEPPSLYIMSHDSWINGYKRLEEGKYPNDPEPYKLKQSLIIIDEAHNFKKEIDSSSTKANKVVKACYQAKRVLLLTASPMMNHPRDIMNYLAMIEGISNPLAIQRRYSDLELYPDEHLRCKFTYFKKSPDAQGYPTVKHHYVKVEMDETYLEKYKHIADNRLGELYEYLQKEGEGKQVKKIQEAFGEDTEKNLKSFLFGTRQAVNKIDDVSPKIVQAVKYIKAFADREMKVLVYSEWLSNGSYLIERRLQSLGYAYTEITGNMGTNARMRAVHMFNEDKPPHILMINKSGAEALDLKGTRAVILLEPYWNRARINQVIGRAVRQYSHDHLPEDERRVDVYTFLLTRPDGLETADELLQTIADEKEEPIQVFEERIRQNAANLKANLKECKKILQQDNKEELDPEYIPPQPLKNYRLP